MPDLHECVRWNIPFPPHFPLELAFRSCSALAEFVTVTQTHFPVELSTWRLAFPPKGSAAGAVHLGHVVGLVLAVGLCPDLPALT